MTRKVVILDVAKPDFLDIRHQVRTKFGEAIWQEVNQEFKETLLHIGLHPEAGSPFEELAALGLVSFRQRLVRQTRLIYEFNETTVIVHMFIHTRRDFRTHLEKRLLA